MVISDAQIQSWTAQGATQQSAQTYEAVRSALTDWTGWPVSVSREVFLQGSYGNATNIRGNSDVDVVVMLTSSYQYDVSSLPPTDKATWDRDLDQATYTYDNFRDHVFAALKAKFGDRVTWGNKCINVGGENQRLNADVVPAILYRSFSRYTGSLYTSTYVEGIRFRTRQEPIRWIINYPKAHLSNGQAKNGATRTSGNYKPLVRAFKNARDYLIGQRLLADGITPSYFLECLIYNAADSLVRAGAPTGFRQVARYLSEVDRAGQLSMFTCQNGVVRLFGATPEQWNEQQASQYIRALYGAL